MLVRNTLFGLFLNPTPSTKNNKKKIKKLKNAQTNFKSHLVTKLLNQFAFVEILFKKKKTAHTWAHKPSSGSINLPEVSVML